MLAGLDYQSLPDLHLAVSVRSFRAEKLSELVGALIAGEIDAARLRGHRELFPNGQR
jgi:hypothetical protein